MNSLMNTDDPSDKSEFTDNLEILRQIEFFSGLPMEVIKLFAFLCNRQSYKSGDSIFQQDDDDQCAYYIISGSARLMLTHDGQDTEIREYRSENFFGVLSLMTPMMKPLSLVANSDTTCLVMTRKAFSKVVDQFPEVPIKIAKIVGQRVLKADRRAVMEFENEQYNGLKEVMGFSLI